VRLRTEPTPARLRLHRIPGRPTRRVRLPRLRRAAGLLRLRAGRRRHRPIAARRRHRRAVRLPPTAARRHRPAVRLPPTAARRRLPADRLRPGRHPEARRPTRRRRALRPTRYRPAIPGRAGLRPLMTQSHRIRKRAAPKTGGRSAARTTAAGHPLPTALTTRGSRRPTARRPEETPTAAQVVPIRRGLARTAAVTRRRRRRSAVA
jgi:hypothetical protein